MGGVAGIATLMAVSALPAAATGNNDGPTGHAYAVQADVNVGGGAAEVNVPPVPMAHYPKGADRSVVKLDVPPPAGDLVKVGVLNGKSDFDGRKLVSDASIAKVSLLNDLIYVEVLRAVCTGDSHGLSGYSDIVKVRIKDQEYVVDAQHPLDVNAAGKQVAQGTAGAIHLVAGEQKKDGNTLKVNALHVTTGGPLAPVLRADIVLSQAVCTLPAGGIVTPPSGGNPGGSTTPSAPGSSSSTSTSKSGGAGATSTSGVGPINNASNNGKLANTGVTGVVPMIIGAVVLLGAGTGALLWTRRRRGAASTTGNDS
ncbi:hypothetical protein GTS_30770 [Gandjariella thermophila]|uniref:LPXTG cell wall anchor domain-containing protein n=1 Tax=Gandjariella thermophila TaxID=1931992 RepID=A0A4D4J7G6_9PSEU|nr:hypothetical protein GTS_30770 [Gandjariella thermophila]